MELIWSVLEAFWTEAVSCYKLFIFIIIFFERYHKFNQLVSGNDILRLLTYIFAEDLDDDGDGIPDEEDDDDDDDEGEL